MASLFYFHLIVAYNIAMPLESTFSARVSKWLMQFGIVSNPSSLGTSVVKSCFSYLSTVIMIKSCDKEKMEFHTSL